MPKLGLPCPFRAFRKFRRSAARSCPPTITWTTTVTTTGMTTSTGARATAPPAVSPSGPLMAADAAVDVGLAHHGDAELGPGLVDLAVNVRRREPPGWLVEELARSLPQLAAYPDPALATRAV